LEIKYAESAFGVRYGWAAEGKGIIRRWEAEPDWNAGVGGFWR